MEALASGHRRASFGSFVGGVITIVMGLENRHGNLSLGDSFGRTEPDRSRKGLLQSRSEHGQMLGVADACGRFWAVWLTSIYCPFHPENWFDSVERVEAGETMDSKHAGLALTA
jgi:hypothetical protein